MQTNNVRPYQKWRWAGDQIFHDTIIPASRTIPGTKIKNYRIDIREFLSFSNNAVVGEAIKAATENLADPLRLRFFTNGHGHFDFRADVIFEWFRSLNYIPGKRRFDQWYFPEETLALGGGDCEDLAFLFAALLLQSGISSYCVRVALGAVMVHDITGAKKSKKHDHAWVVYQKESGGWEIFDPLARVQNPDASDQPQTATTEVEYVPVFVFNNDHLWMASTPEASDTTDNLQTYLEQRSFWKNFNPTFAAGVHNSIFDEALSKMTVWNRLYVKSVSLGIDVNTAAYDPRDHFDSAYIDEGWARVQTHLATGNLADFGLAAHAIGDFYAHSMYGEFAKLQTGKNTMQLYDPAINPATQCGKPLNYNFVGLDLPGSTLSAQDAAQHWNGKLISGQWFRWFAGYPADLNGQRQDRQTLPEHDCIAIDAPTTDNKNHYFVNQGTYVNQFYLRRQAAIEHIQKVYVNWEGQG
ncbi:transglutaminase domain-containing protein [Methylomonas sp. MK1]|uniref:transglutaminase domain-containing protein n=1 Tax=Methylomonas sp. MK1 TaxID=1131552 RepID=UPI00036F0927|nr:transglutaminase domain-containing protein [Methylomonas sp. MK1]